MKEYDPFKKQKQEAYKQAIPLVIKLSEYLAGVLEKSETPDKEEFIHLLKVRLYYIDDYKTSGCQNTILSII